jgi:hypothetical protein
MQPARFKYRCVEVRLRQLALSLSSEARLPGERTLSTTRGYNFLTPRRAPKELVDDGTEHVGSLVFRKDSS